MIPPKLATRSGTKSESLLVFYRQSSRNTVCSVPILKTVFWVDPAAPFRPLISTQTKNITMPCGERSLSSAYIEPDEGGKDGSDTAATPSGAQSTFWKTCSRGSSRKTRSHTLKWSVSSRLLSLRPETTCKRDVCRPYISTFNNATVPVLRHPPPPPPLSSEVGCCLALPLLSTQLKPFPRRGSV